MSISHLITELTQLNLPLGEYAIACSGPLAVRGLREAHDLDVVVTPRLWRKLKRQYKEYLSPSGDKLNIGNVEILGKHLKAGDQIYASAEELISQSEIILQYPFVKLTVIEQYKKTLARQKDLHDLKLIKQYLSNEG
jgi:hypothetical protein